jgi:hypothetical protein
MAREEEILDKLKIFLCQCSSLFGNAPSASAKNLSQAMKNTGIRKF